MKRFSTAAKRCSVARSAATATTRGRPGMEASKSCYVMIETESGGGLSAGLRMGADAMTTA